MGMRLGPRYCRHAASAGLATGRCERCGMLNLAKLDELGEVAARKRRAEEEATTSIWNTASCLPCGKRCAVTAPCQVARLTEDGKGAVAAIEECLEGTVFGGRYSNADKLAICAAWRRRTGAAPSAAWRASL